MITDPKFLAYCRMTCLGGSENGECPCRYPRDCEMISHPDYFQADLEARQRMAEYFVRRLQGGELHPKIAEALVVSGKWEN